MFQVQLYLLFSFLLNENENKNLVKRKTNLF